MNTEKKALWFGLGIALKRVYDTAPDWIRSLFVGMTILKVINVLGKKNKVDIVKRFIKVEEEK